MLQFQCFQCPNYTTSRFLLHKINYLYHQSSATVKSVFACRKSIEHANQQVRVSTKRRRQPMTDRHTLSLVTVIIAELTIIALCNLAISPSNNSNHGRWTPSSSSPGHALLAATELQNSSGRCGDDGTLAFLVTANLRTHPNGRLWKIISILNFANLWIYYVWNLTSGLSVINILIFIWN